MGNFIIKSIYYNNEEWLLVSAMYRDGRYHTHVPIEKKKAAEMIALRATQGSIPKHYPGWMINSINRLWFGKDYLDRKDINNSNLLTNNPDIRIKRRKKKDKKYGCKGYFN